MGKERELRLTMEQIDTLLKKAKLVKTNEAVHRIWIEPGELIIEIVR